MKTDIEKLPERGFKMSIAPELITVGFLVSAFLLSYVTYNIGYIEGVYATKKH